MTDAQLETIKHGITAAIIVVGIGFIIIGCLLIDIRDRLGK